MTAKPPIPPEQRSFGGQKPQIESDERGRPEPNPKTQNTKTQGDEANIRQNIQPQRQVQDR